MSAFSLLSRSLRAVGLLFVCLRILQQPPTTLQVRTSSEQSKPNDTETYTDPDSYQIYAVLLQGEKRSFYVIQAEIDGYPGLTVRNIGIKGDRNFMRNWRAAMEDYAKQNRASKVLLRNIPIDVPYEFLRSADILTSENGKTRWSWDEFYRRYPSAGGYYWFSAVGFNPQKTRAIVDFNHLCGGLCGGGEPHFFEKRNGKWREVQVNGATVSVWAS